MVGEITVGGPGTNRGDLWVEWSLCDTSMGINCGLTVPGGGVWGADGLHNGLAEGFSSYHTRGCHFLMCDGSANFISQNIASTTLAALTTPATVEKISGSPLGGN